MPIWYNQFAGREKKWDLFSKKKEMGSLLSCFSEEIDRPRWVFSTTKKDRLRWGHG
jgi:hypothetical protein